MTPTPRELVEEYKRSGAFDRLRRELLVSYQQTDSSSKLASRVHEIALEKMNNDSFFSSRSKDAIHKDIMTELSRYPLTERALSDISDGLLKEAPFTSGIDDIVRNIIHPISLAAKEETVSSNPDEESLVAAVEAVSPTPRDDHILLTLKEEPTIPPPMAESEIPVLSAETTNLPPIIAPISFDVEMQHEIVISKEEFTMPSAEEDPVISALAESHEDIVQHPQAFLSVIAPFPNHKDTSTDESISPGPAFTSEGSESIPSILPLRSLSPDAGVVVYSTPVDSSSDPPALSTHGSIDTPQLDDWPIQSNHNSSSIVVFEARLSSPPSVDEEGHADTSPRLPTNQIMEDLMEQPVIEMFGNEPCISSEQVDNRKNDVYAGESMTLGSGNSLPITDLQPVELEPEILRKSSLVDVVTESRESTPLSELSELPGGHHPSANPVPGTPNEVWSRESSPLSEPPSP